MAHREGMMFVPRIPPDGIIVESTGLHLKLFSKPSDQFRWRHDAVAPPEARVAQQTNMHRDTKEVFGATSGTDQVNVVPAQQIMADQSIRIRQHLEEVCMRAGRK
ncbi:hypothetical protein GCM10010961_30520 [Pseudodonghicola xiamenensis]|uniref:Uncharacterized protein n=1 Tax=Pseudodonghicola xiamenensis TaxID=337702 RepID=A0A8J3ME74_9RHOB|nr:hypothetical protein GCM10010961_30520 [Pseudodonghicola xiamenensis]